jgi:DNA polymerase-3 subunit gamma/tau
MILQSAPKEGISLLSGISSDQDARQLSSLFTAPQLVYMMNTMQQTLSGFTKHASKRMDTELCLINLCQPELSLDAKNLNARLSKLESQIKSGQFVSAPVMPAQFEEPEEERPPLPDDDDAPPEPDMPVPQTADEMPVGFWADLTGDIRQELKPPVSGFFAPTPNAPVQGVLTGNELQLRCTNSFTLTVINKPEVLALVSQKPLPDSADRSA